MGKYTVYIKLANRQTWWKINRQLANIFNSVFLLVGGISEKPANHPKKSSAISWDCSVMLLIYRSKTASTDMKVKKVTSITTYGLNSQNSCFITFQCTVTGGEGRKARGIGEGGGRKWRREPQGSSGILVGVLVGVPSTSSPSASSERLLPWWWSIFHEIATQMRRDFL